MKLPLLVAALSLAVLFAVQPASAQNAFTPDQVKYGPVPPFLPPGAQIAVLEGDPMASSGDFTIRLKMPDGYKVAPHTHPNRENVTVLSGSQGWHGRSVRCWQDDELHGGQLCLP